MRWLLGSFMHRTLRCTHPFWIFFGSGTAFTRKSKSVLDFSKSDSFIWGKRPKTHGGRKLSSQGNPSSSMALAWHWLSSVCKWLNNIMPILALIMRYHEVCKLLSKTEHSSDLSALGIGLPFRCLVKLPACSQSQSLYSNITRIIGNLLRPLGRGACCLIHSLQTSFQIRNSQQTAYHSMLLCSLSGFTSPFARSLQQKGPSQKERVPGASQFGESVILPLNMDLAILICPTTRVINSRYSTKHLTWFWKFPMLAGLCLIRSNNSNDVQSLLAESYQATPASQ